MSDSTVSVTPETTDAAATAPADPTPAAAPRAAPATPTAGTFIWGTGRRKTSVARVRIRPGSGSVVVNGRPLETFFPLLQQRVDILAPLAATETTASYDIWANIRGGGTTGQAGAMRLGVARALTKAQPELDEALRDGNFLTRDARMVERKKYGQKKARKQFQFSKR